MLALPNSNLPTSVVVLLVASVLVNYFLYISPPRSLLPKSVHLAQNDYPVISRSYALENAQPYNGELPSLFRNETMQISTGPQSFILIIRPPERMKLLDYNGTQALSEWYHENEEWFANSLLEYGGILFRGFPIANAFDFDELIANFHSDSSGTGIYLGTAPRLRIPGTRFVSTASEIPAPITIPTHLELCFTPSPPKRLYFFAEQPNAPPGGQTPLTDFKQVWNSLPLTLQDKFVSRGLLYERRYYNNQLARPMDVLQHKSWQAMFNTSNRAEVDKIAGSQKFNTTWEDNGDLLLTHYAVVNRSHESTGEAYWSTHFNVLHASTFAVPFAWSAQILNSNWAAVMYYVIELQIKLRKWWGFPYGHDMVYSDDRSQVSREDAMLVRSSISRNTWIYDWQHGDVLMLDNHRIAHGRMPYWKSLQQRKVYVAWN